MSSSSLRRAAAPLVALVVGLYAAVAVAATPITRVDTPAGTEVWMVRERSIPILAVEFAFRGGTELDPAGKEGLARFVTSLLDEGAGPYDSLAFQKRLADLAIDLRFSAERDELRVSLRTLSANREEAFRLLALALTAPRFDEEPVARVRSQILSDLERRREDPNAVAAEALFRGLFPEHPYGRLSRGSPETVAAITADDFRPFVERRFARGNVVIGAVGDVAPEELARLIDGALAGLPASAAGDTVSDVSPATDGTTAVIERRIPQSVVMFGLPGPRRDDPDYYATYVLNYVLGGGGFTSRLYRYVREERGLAYSVYSYLTPFQHAGLIMGGLATVNERVAESLAIVREQMARIAAEGITVDELADAKTYLNGSFPLQLDSNAKIAATLVAMQLNDLGIDYIERRADLIGAVALEDVKRVSARYLDPAAMSVVVVGSPVGLASGGAAARPAGRTGG